MIVLRLHVPVEGGGVVLPPLVRRALPTVSVRLASPALPVSPPLWAVLPVRQARPPHHP